MNASFVGHCSKKSRAPAACKLAPGAGADSATRAGPMRQAASVPSEAPRSTRRSAVVRPEDRGGDADEYYDGATTDAYTNANAQIQRELTATCLRLLGLDDATPSLIADVGCGSGLSGEELALARANNDFLFLSAWYLFKPRGKDTSKVRYAENFLERLCERLKGPGTPAEILRGLSDLDSDRFNIMEIRSINGDSFRVTTVQKKKKKRRSDSREENDEENENNENDEKKKRKRKKPGSRALAITPRTLMCAECITDILPFSDDDDS